MGEKNIGEDEGGCLGGCHWFVVSRPLHVVCCQPSLSVVNREQLTTDSGPRRLLNLQLLQAGDDILTGCRRLDLTVNIENLSILANIKRPALRNLSPFMNDAINSISLRPK
ncbi:MAG: hypothetical protein L0Z53_10790 [Acidobacteriales bacterium]|nr:hypothetical protein [Terriglobales bacterium]MCI0418800.1 hypothetical protein [Acidobacteriota bacterium]MCI0625191.1 hypothetical protein [Acidobacteriota bacterium]MCI0723695.1 hypothetical protein [Acidobacteriota bacterium]